MCEPLLCDLVPQDSGSELGREDLIDWKWETCLKESCQALISLALFSEARSWPFLTLEVGPASGQQHFHVCVHPVNCP